MRRDASHLINSSTVLLTIVVVTSKVLPSPIRKKVGHKHYDEPLQDQPFGSFQNASSHGRANTRKYFVNYIFQDIWYSGSLTTMGSIPTRLKFFIVTHEPISDD